MGEKTGVLMMIIATLVVGTLFLAINKGFTGEVSEEVGTKMKSISNIVEEDEDEEGGKGGENTGSIVLNVPRVVDNINHSHFGTPVYEFSDYIEFFKVACAEGGSEYCFDVLKYDEETGGYNSLGEDAINEIKMDTSKVDINKSGWYPVYYTYEDKETGEIYKVATTYEVHGNYNLNRLYIESDGFHEFILDNYGGKNRLKIGGNEILLEGDMPTLQELKDSGVWSMLKVGYADVNTNIFTYKDGNEEGYEIEIPYFDRNIPGLYVINLTYTDSATGVIYEGIIKLNYYNDSEGGVSGNIRLKG